MNINISVEEKSEIERLILILNLGVMHALKKGVISIEESENFLYSPFTMKKLSKLELNEEVITLINLGCELENVERFIPDKLNHSIEEITNQSVKLLQDISRAKLPIKKWID